MWIFAGRGSISDVSEENTKVMVGNKKEVRPLTHHGDIKGVSQGQHQIELAHVVVIIYHRVGNIVRRWVGTWLEVLVEEDGWL